MDNGECVGAVVCKVELNKKRVYQGYIAMLAISATHRGKGLGILPSILFSVTISKFSFSQKKQKSIHFILYIFINIFHLN